MLTTYQNDLHFDLLLPKLKISSTKQLLKTLCEKTAPPLGVSAEKLFARVVEKEERSPSGIGSGIAIPHIQASGPKSHYKILATLDKPIDFSAPDNAPADVVALLVSPQKDGPLHLRSLSRTTRLLQNNQLAEKLREAATESEMRAILIDPEGWLVAA